MYTTDKGDYLIIWITGCVGTFVAEVVEHGPLKIKVEENGPFANLKDGDFIIQEKDTKQFQKDCKEDTNIFLETEYTAGRKVISGLKSLGVQDEKWYEILPG